MSPVPHIPASALLAVRGRCRTFRADTGGFTLLEVALVLAIVGVLAGMMLPTLSLYMTRITEQKTITRQDAILQSLTLFAKINGRLPCPAGPSGGIEPFGAELGSGRQALDVPQVCSRQVGFVPFRTLGLPAVTRNDGWNRPLTYAVLKAFTTAQGSSDACAIDLEEGQKPGQSAQPVRAAQDLLRLLDERGADLSPRNVIAALVVSHGGNGNGAYVSDETLRRVPYAPASELENADDNLTFRQGIYRKSEQDPFDDILAWSNREQILTAFNGQGCGTEGQQSGEQSSESSQQNQAGTPENTVQPSAQSQQMYAAPPRGGRPFDTP
jgi:prepilin-type N-terminal cleavage/methylation domain-containing protein